MQTPTIRCAMLLVVAAATGCGSSTPPARPTTSPMMMMAPPSASQPVAMSVPATAPVVDPPTLKFANSSIDAIQAGNKTATVRKGVRTFPAGLIKAVSGGSDALILQNVITTTKKMSELTDADAKANGSDSLEGLKDDLARDYPGITPDDVVTVITFRLAPGDAAK